MNRANYDTPRLFLERLEDRHFDDLYQLLSNEKVHKHFPTTLNRQEAGLFLQKVRTSYFRDGFSFRAVIRKEDKQFLGICGLLKQIVDGKEEVEVGYRIQDIFWGNGYGPEAAWTCMEYARCILHRDSVISLIRPVNIQSIRVAEKNGMTYERDTISHGLAHRVYRRRFVSNQ